MVENPDKPLAGMRWQQAPDVVARRIRGEVLLVPIRGTSEELDGFFSLNGTASAVWELALNRKTAEEMVQNIVAQFDVQPDAAARDVTRILQELEEIGALIPLR